MYTEKTEEVIINYLDIMSKEEKAMKQKNALSQLLNMVLAEGLVDSAAPCGARFVGRWALKSSRCLCCISSMRALKAERTRCYCQNTLTHTRAGLTLHHQPVKQQEGTVAPGPQQLWRERGLAGNQKVVGSMPSSS